METGYTISKSEKFENYIEMLKLRVTDKNDSLPINQARLLGALLGSMEFTLTLDQINKLIEKEEIRAND